MYSVGATVDTVGGTWLIIDQYIHFLQLLTDLGIISFFMNVGWLIKGYHCGRGLLWKDAYMLDVVEAHVAVLNELECCWATTQTNQFSTSQSWNASLISPLFASMLCSEGVSWLQRRERHSASVPWEGTERTVFSFLNIICWSALLLHIYNS